MLTGWRFVTVKWKSPVLSASSSTCRWLVQLPGDSLSERVLPALFYPGSQANEAGRWGDIINEEHSVDVAIVVLHHGLTETLLSRCVPQLELVGRGKREEKVRDWRVGCSQWLALRGGEVVETKKWQRGNELVGRHGKEKKSCVEIPQTRQKKTHTHTHWVSHNWEGTKKRNKHVDGG